MASKPKTASDDASAQPATAKAAGTVNVTYRPLDRFDPVYTKWNGVRFDANVPVALDPKNPAHQVMVPLPREIVLPDGTVQTKHSDKPVSMIEMAKTNPSFEVEGFPRAKRKVSKRVVPAPGAEWAAEHDGELDKEDEAA